MCIYTVKKQNLKKIKNFQGGCATPANVPKLTLYDLGGL